MIINYAEVSAREPMLINVNDAKKKGICEGAWHDPEALGEKSLCKQGCINVLTRDKGTSSITQGSFIQGVLADLEKYKGEIKLVAVNF